MKKPESPFVFAILSHGDRDGLEVILPKRLTRRAYEALLREVQRAAWRVVGRKRKAKGKGAAR